MRKVGRNRMGGRLVHLLKMHKLSEENWDPVFYKEVFEFSQNIKGKEEWEYTAAASSSPQVLEN